MNDSEPPVPSSAREGRLSHAVFQLARAHRSRAAAMLRALDLHPGQELLLMRLFDKDGQPQSALLDSVGLDHSTVSKSLRRMRDAGLLTREPAEHDRRAAVIWLTDKGRALREPLTAMWRALEETSVRGLSPEEVDTFIDIARRIEAALGDRDCPPPT
ncbi:DNA-binding transcriptional regulator, MarR family [Streptomyces zhaozhouensis]|uniref:DNA-binding transcriptional regulator, MarR family n=1 Tax=Streptomyces zhaozhouensis TaxID=1300267 RepID=A0A286DSA6_9ACTN|nr:MarR family winged helix-turn-helix transcriptional regulator [Streptomyces zhaozhouensis]SOD61556.1 DNA-binding transcriptional regulator, MarR family [Streptomyces zhaozhouensis]